MKAPTLSFCYFFFILNISWEICRNKNEGIVPWKKTAKHSVIMYFLCQNVIQS